MAPASVTSSPSTAAKGRSTSTPGPRTTSASASWLTRSGDAASACSPSTGSAPRNQMQGCALPLAKRASSVLKRRDLYSSASRRPSVFESIATFFIGALLLYLGAGILVPLVLAVLLGFALTPLVNWLNKRLHLPDAAAVLLAVLIAVGGLVAFAYLAGTQVMRLAEELPGYQQTVSTKLEGLQKQFGGGLFEQINNLVANLGEQLSGTEEGEARRPGAPLPVTISNEIGPLGLLTSLLGSIIGPVATVAIVVVFLIFLLLGRADLQDRFIRLVSAGRYSKTNIAIPDASTRVGRYLLLQLGVNIGYGVLFALGLWLIGVPSAILWGLLIILFRYI
ncbi:MAG: AI-2E family transporter, partial [Alphaproteobacteria bacterium]